MNTPAKELPADTAADYTKLVSLLAKFTGATNRLSKLSGAIKERYNRTITTYADDFATLQLILEECQAKVVALAEAHPEWFADSKTITTPYGSVQSRSSSRLEAEDEQKSIELLKQLGTDSEAFLRTVTTLNLEALEILPDEELARIKVKRVKSESITVTPAKVTLGKAAIAAAKKAATKTDAKGGES